MQIFSGIRPVLFLAQIALCSFQFCSCRSGASANATVNTDSLFQERLQAKELELKEAELRLKQKEEALLAAPQKKSLSELYEKSKDAVWLIYTSNNEEIAQGSAFVISESGVAISNYHVFQNATDF